MICKNCGQEAELKKGNIWLCKECYIKLGGFSKDIPYDRSKTEEENNYFGYY